MLFTKVFVTVLILSTVMFGVSWMDHLFMYGWEWDTIMFGIGFVGSAAQLATELVDR